MKISSSYLYNKSLQNIQTAQSDVAKSREQIATGKSLVRPSDDTSKLRNIEMLESQVRKLDSFDRNAAYLQNRYGLEETVLSSASDILIRTKELAIQAANDTLSVADRDIIAVEISSLRDEIISIANTRDVEGNFIFGGGKTDIESFVKSNVTGKVNYQGDNRETSIAISNTRSLTKNRDGTTIFQTAPRQRQTFTLNGLSGVGKFNFKVGSAAIEFSVSANDSAETIKSAIQQSLEASGIAGTAQAVTTNGTTIYSITLSGLNSNASNGVPVTASSPNSNPLTVTLSGSDIQSVGFFDVLGDLVSALSENKRGEIGRSVSELSSLQERLSINVGQVGSSLNNLERQVDINSSIRLRIDELLSIERDLDYAKAVTQFNAEMVRLEATQASFAKIAQLSLFEYI
mgnify:CR=1 FL=1|jgi:flagellar hook-associated protein 3 FlgL|tara:strand:+ start:875 stop:2083 length:1209 start_codon:yes stop_codon:yes gene_type:complete